MRHSKEEKSAYQMYEEMNLTVIKAIQKGLNKVVPDLTRLIGRRTGLLIVSKALTTAAVACLLRALDRDVEEEYDDAFAEVWQSFLNIHDKYVKQGE